MVQLGLRMLPDVMEELSDMGPGTAGPVSRANGGRLRPAELFLAGNYNFSSARSDYPQESNIFRDTNFST